VPLPGRRQELDVLEQIEPEPLGEHRREELEDVPLGVDDVGQPVHHDPRWASVLVLVRGAPHVAAQDGERVLLEDSGLADDLVEDDRRERPAAR